MERVAFLIEASNQRIGCLLNPENLVIQRQAGVRARRSASGQVAGPGSGEDPLLFTGGGRTQFDLDLLFDVDLSGSSIRAKDVRELTRPLQQLAENSAQNQNPRRLPLVRFVWGKTWNIPGYVTAVVERLEAFTPDGVPQRSWLRLRFVRADEAPKESAQGSSFPSLAGITLDPERSSTVPVKTTTLTGGPAVDEIITRRAQREPGIRAGGGYIWQRAGQYFDLPGHLALSGPGRGADRPGRLDLEGLGEQRGQRPVGVCPVGG